MTKCTDNLTLGEIKELMGIFGGGKIASSENPWEIGKLYFIRTVTMHIIGKLKAVGERELVLSNASWIADSGRFYDAIKTGKLNEVEPFLNDVILGRGAIVDATEWRHAEPKEQK